MDKISLRELVFEDLKWLHAIRNDPETRKWLHHQRPFSLTETVAWFRHQNPFFWVALLDGVPFGYFRTDKVDNLKGSIEIGMDIAPEFRGRGLAIPTYKEFINLLKSRGFQTFTLEVLEHNTRAIHLYEKLGFVFQSCYSYPVLGFESIQSILMKLVVDYKIIILGSSHLAELVVERLRKEYCLMGHIPSKNPTIPGDIRLPVLDNLEVEHDIKLSVQYDQKLVDIDRAYNVHTGLLPEYGGCDILAHTLVNGDREQGITFHKMTDKFDAGPIISKMTYPVFEEDTPLDMYRRLAGLIPGFVYSSLELLRTLSEEQVAACFKYPPRMYRRGEFELDEEFKKFRDGRLH